MAKTVWDVYVAKLEEVARTAMELVAPELGDDDRKECRQLLKKCVREVETIGNVLHEVRGRPSEGMPTQDVVKQEQ